MLISYSIAIVVTARLSHSCVCVTIVDNARPGSILRCWCVPGSLIVWNVSLCTNRLEKADSGCGVVDEVVLTRGVVATGMVYS